MHHRKGTSEIISIGDELLIGQVVNTNASWMAEQLRLNGVPLNRISAVGDNQQVLQNILNEAINRSEFIFLTGGLGPTADDITKPALSNYFNVRMAFNAEAFRQIEILFALRGLPVSERNREQAFLPENCIPIQNINGTAPGMLFEHNDCRIIAMPGVPFEMKPMFTDQVIPLVTGLTKKRVFLHKTIMTSGMGESWLADHIRDWEEALPENMNLAYLPKPGIVRLRLSAEGDNSVELTKQIDQHLFTLTKLIPDLIYGFDDETLEEVCGKLLKNMGKTIATAESCTGGHIAQLLTSIAGSSAYYKGSIVAYDNTIKNTVLQVDKQLIEKYGAVSKEVVEAMAINIKQLLNVDYALASSGIAGPDGGTQTKPVGTVWIALAKPDDTISERFQFGEHRGRNIQRSAQAALNMLRIVLIKTHCESKI